MKIFLFGLIIVFFPYLFGWILLMLIISIIFIPLIIPIKYFLPKSRK